MGILKHNVRRSIAACILATPLLCHAQIKDTLLVSGTQISSEPIMNALDETLLDYWLQLDDTAVEALLDDEMPLLQHNSPILPSPESSDLN